LNCRDAEAQRKGRNRRRIAIIGSLLTICVLGYFTVYRARAIHHIEVRNVAGQRVTDLVVQLRDVQSSWAMTRKVASLEPGEIFRIRHARNDTSAGIEFAIAGQKFRHEQEYIDLWTGEGWRFDLQSNGVVTSEHAYAEKRERRR
jgi:hypothetical protein